MKTINVSVAIIGAGSAGMRAYREASRFTDSIVLIEGNAYGTTCASVGCMPSKLLIAAAEAAQYAEHAKPFGVSYTDRIIDGKAVMQRVKGERDRFVGFVVDDVEDWPEAHRVKGHARFVTDNLLSIDDDTEIEAERIIIATGSRPSIIPPFKDFGDRLLINDDIFQWDDLPESVAVFGAGVIGLELGQALHRLGVRVALFGRDHMVGPLTDPEVLTKSAKLFSNEFDFYPHAEVTARRNIGDVVEIDYIDGGVTKTERFEYVLAATGRRPNLDNIGLENTSLRLDERGLPSIDLHTGRIEDSHIFVAGDVNNISPLLHEASDEGAIAGYNAANYPNIRRFSKSSPIGVVFSDPQIMMVGKSYRELVAEGVDFETGALDWSAQGRSRVMLVNKGLLHVYGEKNTGRFLGAEMIGPRAEHIAHLLAWTHQSNLTVSEVLDRPFYHPVFEEGVRTALRDLNHRLQMGDKPPARCIDCGPGS